MIDTIVSSPILSIDVADDIKKPGPFLSQLGIYGFDHLEPIILASLITEDPLLLIGKAGTGKTYLLNKLSEALVLEHKHYNASYLSFDDLIGFPYPSSDGIKINFIPTPATIWDAESILIDELSRCRPEIQNKFFSIIQERKIQGMSLDKLRYRWAAMNPISSMTEEEDHYEGSVTLDQALADRFAFIVEVPDWDDMSATDKQMIIHPVSNGNDELQINLSIYVSKLQEEFRFVIKHPPLGIIQYCSAITTVLTDSGYRISPRRARMMLQSFVALFLVLEEQSTCDSDEERSRIFKLGLTWSLPQRAYKKVANAVLDAAHQQAFSIAFDTGRDERWLHDFQQVQPVAQKIKMLIEHDMGIEYKSIACLQFLHEGEVAEKAIFAFTLLPYCSKMQVVDAEALNALTEIAAKILHVKGTLEWKTSEKANNTSHPQWSVCAKFLATLPANANNRKKRAKQLLLYLILNKHHLEYPQWVEGELHQCFIQIQTYAKEAMSN